MKLTNNTILITGGSSGIGLEISALLVGLGNTLIVTGRDQGKLDAAKKRLPQIHTMQSDVSNAGEITLLCKKITQDFPDLNIVINNAGIMKKINFHAKETDLIELTREIEINLMGPIRMVKEFLPHLKTKKIAAIVNVSSGLAFVPLTLSPVYSATKAAMHSFSQALRVQLKYTNVRVFELAPPGTDTSLFTGGFTKEELEGMKPMDVKVLARKAIEGMQKDHFEIRPGLSNMLKWMSRLAPNFAINMLGKSAEAMLSASRADGGA